MKTRKAPGYEDIRNIQNNYKENDIIKLLNIYVKKTGRLNTYSSSLRPDD